MSYEIGEGSPAPTLKDALKFWSIPAGIVTLIGTIVAIAAGIIKF